MARLGPHALLAALSSSRHVSPSEPPFSFAAPPPARPCAVDYLPPLAALIEQLDGPHQPQFVWREEHDRPVSTTPATPVFLPPLVERTPQQERQEAHPQFRCDFRPPHESPPQQQRSGPQPPCHHPSARQAQGSNHGHRAGVPPSPESVSEVCARAGAPPPPPPPPPVAAPAPVQGPVGQRKRPRRFPCPHDGCPKAFPSPSDLRVHVRTHTGEKPFACEWEGCDKAFALKNNLKAHVRTHTGEKPFQCTHPRCYKAFTTQGNLRVHQRVHTGEKPFVCDHKGCAKAFADAGSLTKHRRVHTGEKPFACDLCGKTFSQTGHLSRHARTHAKNSPVQ